MMQSDLIGFLANQREEYLKGLQLIVDRFSSQEEYQLFLEVLDEIEMPDNNSENLFRLFRYDVLIQDQASEFFDIKFKVDPINFPDPLTFNQHHSKIAFDSFLWNACEIKFIESQVNIEIMHSWYTEAIKADKTGLNKEVKNAIHRMTFHPDKNSVFIDFGSCPPSEIINLFDLLAENNLGTLVICSAHEVFN